MTVLNILRHFKCFYNVLSHCLWLKYCRGCLIWIANGQNLHFVQKYLCFILLRGDQNICGWETDEKLTRLCSSSMDVLPSRSSSRSRDWKLSIDTSATVVFTDVQPVHMLISRISWPFKAGQKIFFNSVINLTEFESWDFFISKVTDYCDYYMGCVHN